MTNKIQLCPMCKGNRKISLENLPMGHPAFGKLVPCPTCCPEDFRRYVHQLRHGTNLELASNISRPNAAEIQVSSDSESSVKNRVSEVQRISPERLPPEAQQILLPLLAEETPSVSFTELSTFQRCRYEFRYRFMEGKAKGSEQFLNPRALIGSALHDALRKFFASPSETGRTLENLLVYYDTAFNSKRKFIEGTYSYPEELREKGHQALEDYFSRNDTSVEPFELEIGFNHLFEGIRLQGRIDRIDQLDDKSFEIIDYKYDSHNEETSSFKTMQAAFYYAGMRSRWHLVPKHVRFYHLDLGSSEVIVLTPNEIKQSLTQVSDMLSIIRSSDAEFPATKNIYCPYCPARPICPAFNQQQSVGHQS